MEQQLDLGHPPGGWSLMRMMRAQGGLSEEVMSKIADGLVRNDIESVEGLRHLDEVTLLALDKDGTKGPLICLWLRWRRLGLCYS